MDRSIKNLIRDSYNANAYHRDKSTIDYWKIDELDKVVPYIKNFDKCKLLDLGAGNGLHSAYLKEKGADVTCVDISEEMIKLCTRKGLNAKIMDFYNLDFSDSSFDVIWSLNTLLHVPKRDIRKVLEGVKRVIREDGIFYLGIYGGQSSEGIYENDFYKPKRFFAMYDHQEIISLVSEYFNVISFNSFSIEGVPLDFQSLMLSCK